MIMNIIACVKLSIMSADPKYDKYTNFVLKLQNGRGTFHGLLPNYSAIPTFPNPREGSHHQVSFK